MGGPGGKEKNSFVKQEMVDKDHSAPKKGYKTSRGGGDGRRKVKQILSTKNNNISRK